MKSKKIHFGSGDALGNTARLIMLGSIDACQPLRKRQRTGLASGLFWLMLLATLGVAAWLILDGFQRGIIPIPLS
ncbi:MAG: hypothetical protein KAJ11_11405 [Alphaproteobacteria bacterium]|nr:hypothetical protein [Alphaproteobacteria bacterium]